MSRDYHKICNNILQSNNDSHTKDILQKSLYEVKKELNILSHKVDRIYTLLVNFIDSKEF
jgi:hypothetical protein